MYPFIPTLTSDMRLATCQLQRPQHRYLSCRLRIHRLPIMAIRRDRDQLHALHYQPKKPTSTTSKIQDSCVVQTDVRILEDITSVIYMIMSSVPHKYYPHVPTNWAIPRGIVGPNIFDSDFRVRSNQDAGCYSCSALLCCI